MERNIGFGGNHHKGKNRQGVGNGKEWEEEEEEGSQRTFLKTN